MGAHNIDSNLQKKVKENIKKRYCYHFTRSIWTKQVWYVKTNQQPGANTRIELHYAQNIIRITPFSLPSYCVRRRVLCFQLYYVPCVKEQYGFQIKPFYVLTLGTNPFLYEMDFC